MKFLFINFVIVLWITSLTAFLLGIFAWIRRRNTVNKCFALYCFSISWWSFCEIWGISCNSESTALLWTRIEQIGVFFIPTFFVHFVISLLNIKDKKWLLKTAYIFSSIAAALCFTPLMMAGSAPISAAPYVKRFGVPGVAYHFAILFFLILIVYGLNELFKAYLTSRGARRNQLKYLFFSTLFGYLGGGANFLLVYNVSIPFLNPFGTYALPIYIAVVTYAIVKYRLMDIRIAAIRTVVFVGVYVPVLFLPFIGGFILKSKLAALAGENWWIIPAIGSSILAPLGIYIFLNIKNRAEAMLLKEQRQYQDTLLGISKSMTYERNLAILLQKIVQGVADSLKLNAVHLFLVDKETGRYLLKASHPKSLLSEPMAFETDDPLIKKLLNEKSSIVIEEDHIHSKTGAGEGDGLKLMEEKSGMKIALATPSFAQNELIAFLLLGDKPNGHMYTQDDLNVFSVLATQAALAIENAIFYEEQGKSLAQELQEHKLKYLGNMASNISHDVNNRFNSVALEAFEIIDQIMPALKQKLGATSIPDGLNELIERILQNLDKISHHAQAGGETVERFRRRSRQAKIEPLDLAAVIESTLSIVVYPKEKAGEIVKVIPREVYGLEVDLPTGFPKLSAEVFSLENTIANLLRNAYEAQQKRREIIGRDGYSPFVKISAQVLGDTADIKIADNGIGMTPDQLNQIFVPFYTTKVKGTGLGLSILKSMIELQRGKISVDSEYGKGTTFTITLPVAKEGSENA